MEVKNSLLGVLYGQLIGDALGASYEFLDSNTVISKLRENIIENNYVAIIGGGNFNVNVGQITDDSEMALGLLNLLLDNSIYDNELVAKKYIDWCNSMPFDIGITTKNAFHKSNNYMDCVNNSFRLNKKVFSERGVDNYSNGCLMRISPLAIFGYIKNIPDSDLAIYAINNCIMTNPNELCIDCVVVYTLTIRKAITVKNRKLLLDYAMKIAKNPFTKQFLKNAIDKNNTVVDTLGNIVLSDIQNIGFIGISFQNAFYQLLHGTNFYKSIVNTIAIGGDTDTNGCICGALLGAYYGISNIPKKWINTINTCNVGNNIITNKNRYIEYPDAHANLAINKLKLHMDYL